MGEKVRVCFVYHLCYLLFLNQKHMVNVNSIAIQDGVHFLYPCHSRLPGFPMRNPGQWCLRVFGMFCSF